MRVILRGCKTWSQHTMCSWSKKARDAIHHVKIVKGGKLGGIGKRVQIDECAFGKAKLSRNHCGRPTRPVWLVGMFFNMISLT